MAQYRINKEGKRTLEHETKPRSFQAEKPAEDAPTKMKTDAPAKPARRNKKKATEE